LFRTSLFISWSTRACPALGDGARERHVLTAVFPLIFWGVGLVPHGWNAYFSRPITDADVEREASRQRGGPNAR
jgi:hypothetical protein